MFYFNAQNGFLFFSPSELEFRKDFWYELVGL